MIQLSKRLQAVADYVPSCISMADVGTDHGYIPIYLVERGICEYAIAMDINKGPLLRAEEHILRHQLQERICTRLSNGLDKLEAVEVQAIVIAGMGGATMQEILSAKERILTPEITLVLQPQSELYEFRTYLVEHGYQILDENMVWEDGKYYPMMKVVKVDDDNRCQMYSQEELLYGPILLRKKHPILQEFLQWQLQQNQKIASSLEAAKEEIKEKRLAALAEEKELILKALAMYQE